MSSMADIAFLLIIFFMLTTVFDTEKGLNIQLPSTKTSQQIKRETVVVSVDSNSVVRLDGEQITLDQLKEKLIQLREINPDKGIILKSDKRAAYGTIAQVVDTCIQAGITNVALPTLEEQDSGESTSDHAN